MTEPSLPSVPTKKDRGLSIRPLKLNEEESNKLAASAQSAIPIPPPPPIPIGDEATPRPRKRLPSGKNKRSVSRKDHMASRDAAQTSATDGGPSDGNMPTSESDSQAAEMTVEHHVKILHQRYSSMTSMQDAQHRRSVSTLQAYPPAPRSDHSACSVANSQHGGIQVQQVPDGVRSGSISSMSSVTGFSTPVAYHASPTRAHIATSTSTTNSAAPGNNNNNHFYSSHGPTLMGAQPNFSYPTPPTHAPPHYLSGVHPRELDHSHGFSPKSFGGTSAFSHSGMAM